VTARRLLSAVVLAAALPLSGCAQKKVAECNAIVQVINGGVLSVEKAPKTETDPSGATDLKAMAETMDKIASDAAAVQLTLPELKKVRDDYQKMAKEIARAERDLATAVEKPDAAKRTAAEAGLEAAVKLEDPLVDQLNKICMAP
jgi:hypothetical protein